MASASSNPRQPARQFAYIPDAKALERFNNHRRLVGAPPLRRGERVYDLGAGAWPLTEQELTRLTAFLDAQARIGRDIEKAREDAKAGRRGLSVEGLEQQSRRVSWSMAAAGLPVVWPDHGPEPADRLKEAQERNRASAARFAAQLRRRRVP